MLSLLLLLALQGESGISILEPGPGAYVSGDYDVVWDVIWPQPIVKVEVILSGEVVLVLDEDKRTIPVPFGETTDHTLQLRLTDNNGQTLLSKEVPTKAIRFDFEETSRLLLLPVVVRTRSNNVLNELGRDRFRVFEDDKPVPIQSFQHEQLPLDLILLLDSSSSMRTDMPDLIQAGKTFVTGLTQKDKVSLIKFSNEPEKVLPFTNDRKKMARAIQALKPYGETALFDALHLAIQQLKERERGRRAIILFTDGRDSIYEEPSDLVRMFRSGIEGAQNEEITVFTLGFGEKIHGEALERIALETGGRYQQVKKADGLNQAFMEILEDLRSQYMLGIIPQSTQKGFHSLRVDVKKRNAIPYYRKGYTH